MLISRHYFTVQQELGDSFTAVDHLLLTMYTNKDFFQVLGANGLNKVCHPVQHFFSAKKVTLTLCDLFIISPVYLLRRIYKTILVVASIRWDGFTLVI